MKFKNIKKWIESRKNKRTVKTLRRSSNIWKILSFISCFISLYSVVLNKELIVSLIFFVSSISAYVFHMDDEQQIHSIMINEIIRLMKEKKLDG